MLADLEVSEHDDHTELCPESLFLWFMVKITLMMHGSAA